VLSSAYARPKAARTEALLAAGRAGVLRLESSADPLTTATGFAAATRGGHLRAYAVDPAAEHDFAAAGIDGAVAQAVADYLLLIEQNAGGNKLDYYLGTRISDVVKLDPHGTARSRIGVQLVNGAPRSGLAGYVNGLGEPGKSAGFNRTYLSLYTARASQMLSFRAGRSRTAESWAEFGRPVFSWFQGLPPQASASATLTLTSPHVASRRGRLWTYQLLVQRQPQLNPPSLDLVVVPPAGARVRDVSGAAARVEHGGARFHLSLDRDHLLTTTYCFCQQGGH
jgi:hypothetical protein